MYIYTQYIYICAYSSIHMTGCAYGRPSDPLLAAGLWGPKSQQGRPWNADVVGKLCCYCDEIHCDWTKLHIMCDGNVVHIQTILLVIKRFIFRKLMEFLDLRWFSRSVNEILDRLDQPNGAGHSGHVGSLFRICLGPFATPWSTGERSAKTWRWPAFWP